MAGSRTKGMRKRNPKTQRIARVPRNRLWKVVGNFFSRFLVLFLTSLEFPGKKQKVST